MDSLLVRAEVDLEAIAHNVREIRRITHPDAKVMAVVKANGYGHGAVEVAGTALDNGAEALAVARIEEAIELRRAGINVPVLILGHTPVEAVDKLIRLNLTQTVYSRAMAGRLSDAARIYGKKIRTHIKTDTGMGRIGIATGTNDRVPPDSDVARDFVKQAVRDIGAVCRLPGLDIEGIFTHFATADEADTSFALHQFNVFNDCVELLRRQGIDIPIRHAANSAAVINLPGTHLDMVRPGIAIYGLYPSAETDRTRAVLIPAMTLKARIVHVKHVPAGFRISYGSSYRTPKPTDIATVNIGYADGVNRLLSSKGCMLVRGHRAPVVGRICMDMTMLDVGHIPNVRAGDDVVVFGKQGDVVLDVDEAAAAVGTINYEVVSLISQRVHRVYQR